MRRRALVAAAFLGGAAGMGGYVLSSRPPDLPVPEGLLWPNPPLVHAFELDATQGSKFNVDSLKGRWTFVFFGFTFCPDICPTTLITMAEVAKRLRQTYPSDAVQVVFVSVDPKRDTLERMASYVRHFDEQFVGARAELERLNGLTSQLGIAHFRGEPDENGHYDVDHSASIVLIDPNARRVGVLSTPHTVEDIVARYARMRAFLEANT